jgi:tetratricopeptide (TPR) repeat protein
MKGDDLYAKGLYNESLSSYEKSISYDPFSFRSWKGKGQVLLALGIPDDAARAFLQALKLDPTDAGTYALLGDARIASGDYKDAAEQYLKALAINPKIEGVPEKLSAAYAANNPVQAVETMTDSPSIPPTTGTPALPDQGISAAGDTVSLTVKETLPAAPAATVAGFPGAVAGILGALLVFILIGFSRK